MPTTTRCAGQRLAVGQRDLQVPGAAADVIDTDPEPGGDAVPRVHGVEQGADLITEHTRRRRRLGVDHGHLVSARASRSSNLCADEPSPHDHDGSGGAVERFLEVAAPVEVAQHMHAGCRPPWRRACCSAGRQDDGVEGDQRSVGQHDVPAG